MLYSTGNSTQYSVIAYMEKKLKKNKYLHVLHCAESLSHVHLFATPMDCSLPDTSDNGDSPGQNTGVGCHALFQGIFPTQGSKPGLPHCRQILYHLSHQGSRDICICITKPHCSIPQTNTTL